MQSQSPFGPLTTKLLVFEEDDAAWRELSRLLRSVGLKSSRIKLSLDLPSALRAIPDLGAVVISSAGGDLADALTDAVRKQRAELPIFIGAEESETDVTPVPWKLANQGTAVCRYKHGSHSSLIALLREHVFYQNYPEGLLHEIETAFTIATTALIPGVKVSVDQRYVAADQRFRGERVHLMPIESYWAAGVMMLETFNDEIYALFNSGRIGVDRFSVAYHAQDLLRELMNHMWGRLQGAQEEHRNDPKAHAAVVPASLNFVEKEIDLGASVPMLCFAFQIEDRSTPAAFPTIGARVRFCFHKYVDAKRFNASQYVPGELRLLG